MNKYIRPKSLEELTSILSTADDKTRILAGGTDLNIKLRDGKVYDCTLVDITGIGDFHVIKEDEETIFIGACTTMTELETSPVVKKYFKGLSIAGSKMGSTQIRNIATVGGNAINAAHCSDTLPCLFAYGARAKILDHTGNQRDVDMAELIVSGEKTSLNSNEVILGFTLNKNCGQSSFVKLASRKAVSISKLNICLVTHSNEEYFNNPTVYLGSMGEVPSKGVLIEEYLSGKKLSEINSDELSEVAESQVEALIPARASRFYKKEALKGVLIDLLEVISNGK